MLVGDSLEEKFAFARSVGFDGIELSGRGNGVFADRFDELAKAREAGVEMPSAVVAMEHFVGAFDPDDRAHAIADVLGMLPALGAAGAGEIVMPNGFAVFSRVLPPFQPPRGDEESHELLVDALRELGEAALANNTSIFLEPLNRYEDYLVVTLADGSSVVDEVASPAPS